MDTYYFFIAAIFILMVGVVILYFVRLKNELTHEVRESKKISPISNSATAAKAIVNNKEYISKEKENKILKQIKEFEKKKFFLNKDISLNVLSANFGVNHRYLSYVINKHMETDFSSYVNELRVKYIVDCLKKNPRYLQYKISYLAEKCGFASHSRFTITFKKVTGVSPSSYINTLKNTR